MKIFYIVISAFFIIFFPRQLTSLICFGRHRDQNIVNSKVAYWGIYSFWTIIFLIGCLMMGSAAGVSTVMDKVFCYFILVSDDRDCIKVESEENDETYISSYFTRAEVDDIFLLEIVQKYTYMYDLYQLQNLTTMKVDKSRWIIYLNDEVMGYVEVKNVFFIKELCYIWDRQKLDQRRKLYE